MEFHDILDRLIALNRARRSQYIEEASMLGMVRFAMEFCTVHCDIGRRSGKTEYIKRRADADSLVIVFNEIWARELRTITKAPVISASRHRSKDFQWGTGDQVSSMIYIDEPSLVFRVESQDEIYSALARNPDQTFILLGR